MLLLLFLYHHFHNCAGVTDWAHPGTMVYLCKIYAVFKWGKKNPHAASEPRRTSPLLQLIYNTQIAFFVGRARKAPRALWQVLTQEETICLIIRARTYCASSLFWLSHKHSYLSQSCLWWLRKQDPPTPLLLSWQAWIKDMQRNWVTVVSGNLQQLKVRFFLHLHLHLPSDTWLPA